MALNLTIGVLIIIRSSASEDGSTRSVLISLPSFICGGLIFKLSQPVEAWPTFSVGLFSLGVSWAIVSSLCLGKSFAIFPSRRKIISHGTYRLLRHPTYLGELVMVLACVGAAADWISLLLLGVFVVGIILRIKEEEKILLTDAIYQRYAGSVPWKLVPFIW